MTTTAIQVVTDLILANEIVFHSRHEASIYGFRSSGGTYIECEFVMSSHQLQTLLSNNGKVGIEILWHVEQLFVQPHEVPACISLLDLFGITQEIKSPCIAMEMGEYEGDEDASDSIELWFIQSV